MIIDSFLHPHIDGIKKMIKNLSFKDFVDISNKKFYEKILGNTLNTLLPKTYKVNFLRFGIIF